MPESLIHIGAFALGVAMLLVGGDGLVRGATGLALRLGVAPLVIGLTVVAFGTSAPELALNVAAAFAGNTDLSFGNIVGSNIANVGLILGLSSLIRPMKVNASLIKRELPLMILATFAMLALAWLAPGTAGGRPGFSGLDGAILLAGFAAFCWLMFVAARGGDDAAGVEIVAEADELTAAEGRRPVWLSFGFTVVGLALLVVGGAFAERGAVGLAEAMGLSSEVIGLTIVAVATSLPELATSLMAARRGQIDIAVGNVVGSNLFNILLVMGTTAAIRPVPVPPSGPASLGVMALLSVLLLPMSLTASRYISRLEGGALLLIYAGYLGWQTQRVMGA